jgi:hypothetical protein
MPKVKHAFTSAKANGPDSTFVKPGDWNADHVITTAAGSVYMGRDATGPGPMQEFPIDHAASGDDLTMWTKAQVQAAIAAAVSGIDIPVTGALRHTFNAVMPGWLSLNGQSIGNVGSVATFANASAQALFNLFWAINSGTWPVLPARGASAAADWAALKTIALPDARGCVLGLIDAGRGITPILNVNPGIIAGEALHALTVAEMPSHAHQVLPAHNASFNNGGGQVGGGAVMWDTGVGVGTAAAGGNAAHNIVQPTMGTYIFIKL